MRRMSIVLSTLLLLCSSAAAQTGLGIEAGILQPFGDFGDTADMSPAFGVRWEVQDVNALGQVATVSFLARGLYAIVKTDADLADAIEQQGGSVDDGGLFEVGGAVRAYSSAAPLFVSIGAHYANLDPGGNSDNYNAFGGFGGLGLRLGASSVHVDIEARFCFLIPEEIDNQTYATYTAALAFPF